jgi:two-component system, LytTR family, response regulator LytT
MKILIVEDEPLLARRLERLCTQHLGPRLKSIRHCTLLSEATSQLRENPIDLLLLDLNLHGEDGMELLRTAVAESFQTIIVSANIDQALRAFEYGVIDFVPKPITAERLAQAINRVTQSPDRLRTGAKYLAIKKHGRVELLDVNRVLFAQGAGAYAEVVLDDGRRELHDKTLDGVHAILPEDFERIHKSFVVRRSAIRALLTKEGSQYEAELHNGLVLPVGRSRYKELKEKLLG